MITKQDERVMARRRKVLRHLTLFTWVAPVAWIGITAWLWLAYPDQFDTRRVMSGVIENTYSQERVEGLAMSAPVIAMVLQGVILFMLVVALLWMHRERRWIELLDAYRAQEAPKD